MSSKIRVATYNVGDFSGIDIKQGSENSRTAFREVFEKTNADLWALQEDVEFFNEETKELPYDAIYKHVLPNHKRNYTMPYNGKAFLSKFKIFDAEAVLYQGDYFDHPWYYKGKINVENIEVTIVSLHFDWSDKFVRAEQIKQLIEFAKMQEYCIIMGDFNPEDYVGRQRLNRNLLYKEEFARFTEAGFESANGGKFGTFDTIVHPGKKVISPCPFDNIIVTPNIKILSADRGCEPWMDDHAIMVADLEIN